MGHLKTAAASSQDYIGRFAPSPTGLLHLGSLLTAVASYLDAKYHQGLWLVRMEDLDPPREMKGAKDAILKTLECYGLEWDGSVWFQSQRHDTYQLAVNTLLEQQQAYYCTCSRKPLLRKYGARYPGLCRGQDTQPAEAASIRLQTADQELHFIDRLQGRVSVNLSNTCGDFIIRRKDLLFAYHLAVVVDDEAQNITHVVRGNDLLDSTPCHLYLQQQLGYNQPEYAHIPVIVDANGHKLSKQTFATPIPDTESVAYLWRCLQLLQLNPPTSLQRADNATLLAWGIAHWQPEALRGINNLTEQPLPQG